MVAVERDLPADFRTAWCAAIGSGFRTKETAIYLPTCSAGSYAATKAVPINANITKIDVRAEIGVAFDGAAHFAGIEVYGYQRMNIGIGCIAMR